MCYSTWEVLPSPPLVLQAACISSTTCTHAQQLDTDEVTVENSMSKSFDQVIRMQLDPVWNQLVNWFLSLQSQHTNLLVSSVLVHWLQGSKTKQLVFDLRMLRTLLLWVSYWSSVCYNQSYNHGKPPSLLYAGVCFLLQFLDTVWLCYILQLFGIS